MGGMVSKPKMPKVEPPPEPVDQNAADMGMARADALRQVRARNSLLATNPTGSSGVMGKPNTRSASLLGR